MLKRSTSTTSRVVSVFLMLTLLVALCGCRPDDQIERYQVARAKLPHRMLGAVVPQGEREWFFKVTGSNEVVAEYANAFTDFIKTIRFGEGDDSDPEWELPTGWTQEAGEAMRYATIKIPTDEQPLELTVIPLPVQPNAGLLDNINRWRSQLGLAPVDAAGLAKESTAIKLAGGTATLVNLVGKSGSSAPMSASAVSQGDADPDAAMNAAHAAAGIATPAGREAPVVPPSSITYEAPPDWEPGQRVITGNAFSVPREAAFVVEDGGRAAQISITKLGAAASEALPNVNRWRAQVGLDPVTEEQLAKESQKIDMHGVEGDYFRLVGPQQAILGVIATHGDQAWFVKLQGDHDLAIKLQTQFETFVRSIKF